MATSDVDYTWKEPSKPITRGAFIVIEGLDRSGKTTQVVRLCDALYRLGHNVKPMRFPDRSTVIGQTINSYLTCSTPLPDQSIHLLFSANRWERAADIKSWLASGYNVICDRYYYSGMIYSASKQNPELKQQWARAPEVGLPMPDLVVFLDLQPEEAERRGDWGGERYEVKDMQERVRREFLALKETGREEGRIMVVVDAGRGIEYVGKEMEDLVTGVLERVESGALGREIGRVMPYGSVVGD